jgi:hypothetical protein
MNQRNRYLAYLLRLWQESAGDSPGSDPPLWRASLQSPQSDERLGFASLEDLFTFLEKETGPSAPDSERAEEEGRR